MRWLPLVALAGAVLASRASADLVVTLEHKDLKAEPPRLEVSKLFLSSDKVKVEGGEPAADAKGAPGRSPYSMIYRGDRDLAWILDPGAKTYMAFDKQSMQAVTGQLDAAMKQLQDQMAEMPEEQRKMVEQAMKGKMPGAAAAKAPVLEVKNTGEKQTQNGVACVRYDCLADGKKQSEIWVTKSWGKATPESFAVLKKMAKFFQDLLSGSPMLQEAASQEKMWSGFERIDGVPVLIRQFDGTTVTSETLFKSVEETKLGSGDFDLPSGYTERKMGGPR